MKKAKPKKKERRKTVPPKKQKAAIDPALKARLEAEFAQAVKSAKDYVDNPQRLRDLFQEASKEAASMPTDPFKDTWAYLQTMLRLVRAYYRGEYREITESTLVVIIAAIIYMVSPLDVIPDAIPALGFLDDATVLALAIRRTRDDLDRFMVWETVAS
jgi:uncharacterized membrane protein YkvA (DUF1232 family)